MALNQKRVQQIQDVAASSLELGERIEVVTAASVGTVSVKKKVLTAAAAGIATGGLLMVSVRPRRMYVVSTDRRLVFFDADTASGKPGKLLMILPKANVTASEVKRGLMTLKAMLSVDGQDQAVRVMFPKPCRDEGTQILGTLGTRQS